jgi:phosphoesterase RecJ-like protein
VSVFIREVEEPHGYKVSLRSNDYVNVSDVALMFGGGGHTKAAGCFIAGNMDRVKEKLMAEIKKVLK